MVQKPTTEAEALRHYCSRSYLERDMGSASYHWRGAFEFSKSQSLFLQRKAPMHIKPMYLVVTLLTTTAIVSGGYLVSKTSDLSKLNSVLSNQLTEAQNKISELSTQANELKTSQNKQFSEEQNKAKLLENKVSCLELIKITPDTGPGEYIGKDIVNYYKYSVEKLNSVKAQPTRPDDSEDAVAERKFWQSNVDKAKPLYDTYMSQCGSK